MSKTNFVWVGSDFINISKVAGIRLNYDGRGGLAIMYDPPAKGEYPDTTVFITDSKDVQIVVEAMRGLTGWQEKFSE